ncbi:MAG TPA: sensor domain-containing protein [Amycolatopsis sp.]|nr:sensor domain-containing protein [Amycolatopsis sp.]
MDSRVTTLARQAGTATARGVLLVAGAVAALVLVLVAVCSMAFMALGAGVLAVPTCVRGLRWLAQRNRELAGKLGVPIEAPYLPARDVEPGIVGRVQRCRWLLADPATWRDLAWALLNTVVGFVLGLLPVTLLAYAIEGFAFSAGLWQLTRDSGVQFWYSFIPIRGWPTAALGALFSAAALALWAFSAPWIVKGQAYFSKPLLGQTQRSRLAQRVRQLADTRTDAIDASDAELRRIERDLHDGTQARLVAIGMKLSIAEHQLDSDPALARTLVAEARDASAKALAELRNLIRGIHPPVLAERGLDAAVRALALDAALDVTVSIDLPGRAAAPIESTAYFAVSELLTNVSKHAGADAASVHIGHENNVLRIVVTDDGRGGADAARGSGLRGIQRRCATFDGTLFLASPEGGPTVATLELPCALS